MRAIAALLVVTCTACVPLQPSATLPELHACRKTAFGNRTLSGVGLAVGVVAAIAGGFLTAHAAGLRSRESTADAEDGIGSLLGGMFLVAGGSALTIASTVGLVVTSDEIETIDERIRRF